MKKNVIIRVAAILMILTVLSMCAISGTFAKYVTEGTPSSDTARVAKWGVKINATSDTLFETTYATDDTNEKYASITNSVVTNPTGDGKRLVAPGTTVTDFSNVTLSGTPEVAVEVSYVGALTLTGWTVDSADYCPLVITVEGDDYYIGQNGINSVATLESAVEEAIAGCTSAYAANTDLSTVGEDAPSISWKWYFDSAATGNPLSDYQTDVKDTALGDAATAATIELTITTTVTQID